MLSSRADTQVAGLYFPSLQGEEGTVPSIMAVFLFPSSFSLSLTKEG